MNGSSGIQPTVELATTNGNGFYPYPMPYYGNNGNDGFFGGEGIWAIIILALLFGNGGWGGFGGFGGFGGIGAGLGMTDGGLLGYAIGNNATKGDVSDGFNSLHLSNQIEGVRDGIYGLSNQVCGATSDVIQAINGGFSNAEISNNARQVANMQQAFNSEINTLNGFNNLNNALQNCCCENRLASCQTQNIVQNEGNQTRFADANNTRDIITNATSNTQAILDKLCQLELDNVKSQLDAKNDRIGDLQREILMKDLQASQVEQTATLRLGQEAEVDSLYNRLKNCPVGTTPVYGNQPIFTCPNNLGNGCGCNNGYNQFI